MALRSCRRRQARFGAAALVVVVAAACSSGGGPPTRPVLAHGPHTKTSPGPGAFGRFPYRPPLYRGRAGGNAHDDLRRGKAAAVVHLADEMLDHFFRHLEIRDDTVAQWPDRLNVARSAAEHQLGFLPDRKNLVAIATTEGSFSTMPRPLT